MIHPIYPRVAVEKIAQWGFYNTFKLVGDKEEKNVWFVQEKTTGDKKHCSQRMASPSRDPIKHSGKIYQKN